jgi:predicted MFS family arabinose efflux permease
MTLPPTSSTETQKRNYRNVQIDAVGVSISNIAAPFLPVFLTRLGASSFQIGLLTSMPGVTGLILAILVGRFLQTRHNIVKWYSLARLMVISCYTLTGILTLILPQKIIVASTLGIWAFATLPQVALAVAFSVVMNAVAGPEGRYSLLSRRWAIFGLTTFIGTYLITRVIDLVPFPANYAFMFLGLSLGGLISFNFSNRIQIPDQQSLPLTIANSPGEAVRNTLRLVRSQPAFTSFVTKRLVYLSAIALSAPLFPLYFVRVVGATDKNIGTLSMIVSLVMLFGYFIWTKVSRQLGGRFVLLATTLGVTIYPALTALTHRMELIFLYAGIYGLFQAGLDLVFFDELMKTVPPDYSATFVSLAQSLQYLSAIIAPLVGTWLADSIGLGGGLLISAGLRLLGFLLFLIPDKIKEQDKPES